MTTTTAALVEAVVAALVTPSTAEPPAYPTDAGQRVFAPRDWPTWDNLYPAIFVSAPRERKESLGRNQPQYTVTTTIRIWTRFSAPGSSSDGGAGAVQAELWALQRQIELALINAPSLMPLVQQIAAVSAEIAFDSTGEKHLGAMVIDLDLEFYQGPEDFYPIASAPLTSVAITTAQALTALDLQAEDGTPLAVGAPGSPRPPVSLTLTLPE